MTGVAEDKQQLMSLSRTLVHDVFTHMHYMTNPSPYQVHQHKSTWPAMYRACFVYTQACSCNQRRKHCLQDDMKLAVDFFTYFEAGAQLLDADPDLYCVSSWNDHGQRQFVQDARRLERSDFFPGLGWMLTKALWQSFK